MKILAVSPRQARGSIFNTGPYGDPPFENQNFENLSWPKLGLEPKFHEPGTFGGFGKREHTDKIHKLALYV